MSENTYYHGGERIVLDTDEAKLQLTHRLRQYMEVRNFALLVGNGCSIPLGAPVIHDTAKIFPELDSAPYRLENATDHSRARELLDLLIPKAAALGVEPLLTVLASIQATESIVRQSIQVKNKTVESSDARLLERLLKKWLFYRCAAISEVNEELFRSHQELIR
jgi:hypothetical protein